MRRSYYDDHYDSRHHDRSSDRQRARYREQDDYWEHRIRQAIRGRDGFSWGVFFFGLIVGAIIF